MIKDKYIQKLEELNKHLYQSFRFQSLGRIEMFHEIRIKLESELSSLKAQMEKEENGNSFMPKFTDGFRIDIRVNPGIANKGHGLLLVHPDDADSLNRSFSSKSKTQ